MLIKHLSLATRHLLFWSLIAAAILLSAVRILLTQVDNYKAKLEQTIQQTIQLPIHIGKLSPNMRGFSPGLLLQEIKLDTTASQSPLELKEVRLGIDLLQLVLTQDPLAASWVSLVGLKIQVIRNPDGKISIKGLPSSEEQPNWLMQGSKYEILQSQVSWLDLQAPAQHRIDFDNFNLVLKNHFLNGEHELHCQTSLPEQYGDQLRVSAQLTGNIFTPETLAGQLFIEASNLQGPALAADNLPLNLKLVSGSGDIKIWSQWQQAQPVAISGYVQGQQIKIDNAQHKRLALDTLQGNISWSNKTGNWRLTAYDIDIFANHQHWPNAEFTLAQNLNDDWSVLIKQIDLNALSFIAPWFIGADSSYADLSQLNLKGKINNLKLFAEHDWQHYALEAQFDNMGSVATDKFPGLSGFSGRIHGNQTEGDILFNSQRAQIDAPALFRNLIEIDRLSGRLHWQQTQHDWQLSSAQLKFDSADFKSTSQFQLSLAKNGDPATLHLASQFSDFQDISHIPLYLPAKVMGADAVAWLDDAFVSGQISQGQILIDGRLDQLPFSHGEGRFDTLFTISNGEMQFNSDWPHLQDLYASVHFERENLEVAIHEGRSEKVTIKQAVVGINDLANSNAVQVHGQLSSQINHALQLLQHSPLHSHVDDLIRIAKTEGNTQIDLDLNLPYEASDPVDVKVDAHLNNNKINLGAVNLLIDNINGELNFTEDRISSNLLKGKTLGAPITAQFSSNNSASQLLINGNTTLSNLQRQFSFLANDSSKGSLAYQAELILPYDDKLASQLNINTNLQGVSIIGDDWLAKTADQAIPLHLNFKFDGQKLLPLAVDYGDNLHAALLIDAQQNHLYSGHIVIGGNPASSFNQAGLKLEIKQPSFKASQAVSAFNDADSGWPAIRELMLDTHQLIWQGNDFGAVRCHFQHSNQSWNGLINTTMANGHISIPDQRAGNERIKLDMDSINLSALSNLNLDGAEQAFNVLPLIEIDSQQLWWRGTNLGSLKLQTERLANGIHFKKIKINGAGKSIDLSADWIKHFNGTSTQLNGRLSMNGFGQFLSDLGYSDDFKETHAELNFTGGWSGAPHQFALERLNGILQVKLTDGRISSIEPGFGRLLGLLAMEQWVKRLSLNFTDIYRQGLSFDEITGSFKINNGLAYSNDLLVDAVAAKMKILGTANLVNKTMDHRVAVIPKSSDAVPIAGTIVSGIAAMITNAVTDDYQEGYFFGSEYKISGQWGDLEVTPVRDHDGLVNKTWHGLTDFSWLK